jgi:transposase
MARPGKVSLVQDCVLLLLFVALVVSFQKVVHSDQTEETGVTRLQLRRRIRMNIHKNARLTLLSREEMALAVMEGRLSQAQAALQYAVTAKVVKRWVERYRAKGRAGMADRSSRPRRSPNASDQVVTERIVALWRQRFTGKHIASLAAVSPATVSRVLKRAGLSRLKDLEPAEPVRRYEREHPGDMIHIDIKKLRRFERIGHRITGDRTGQSNSRGVGWEYVHVCIDDASRIAFSQILSDERRKAPSPFSRRRAPTTLASAPAS